MSRNIFKVILILVFLTVFAGVANAAGSLSVRIERPKSPTNQDTLKINFVSLDIQGRAVTAKCFKKGPSDGGFVQFGSDIALGAGGNTNNCNVDSAIINQADQTYQFFVRASAGVDTLDSEIVTVDFKTSGPGTPTNYSKEKISSCTYRIKFRTADDGGKTVKVELYRSDSTSFTADSGTRVDSIAIGSNTDGQFENTVPDCGKTYYFALRAFDSTGNGSGIVSDSETKVTTTTVIPTTAAGQVLGAIPVVTGGVGGAVGGGQVLGEGVKEPKVSEKEKGKVLGEGTPSAKPTPTEMPEKTEEGFLTRQKVIGGIALFLLALGLIYAYRKLRT